jgi:glycosyltransferase involved in cell wall biosynthesis
MSPDFNKSALRKVVVDLTPMLPGGANGGAKGFILELVRELATLSPETEFILLTQIATHEELAALERANVRRILAIDPSGSGPTASLPARLLFRILPHLPVRVATSVARIGSQLLTALKRRKSNPMIGQLNADLLFCPFTAPTYHDPGVPLIATIYDLQYAAYPEFFTATEIAHRGRSIDETCRKSHMLVAISEFSRVEVIAKAGLDPSRVRTVHLQISKHLLTATDRTPAILGRLNLDPARYLIYPANFWKHKNHEMLLTAFGMARARGLGSDIRLVCTGAPGERQEWLLRAARNMNLAHDILFPGYLSDEELLALITNSAGLVFPSLYEGFGLPVAEAMALGIPVGCSNVASLPEIAGNATILFDPWVPEQIADAMISLAHDEELRQQLIERGRIQAARFVNSQQMAKQYLATFNDVVDSHRATSGRAHP